jgi:hypothetical protein
VGNRNASNKAFDPSSFDDVLDLVSTWTREGSMTAPQIVEALRAHGVVVRATTSGRHAIVESTRCCSGERSEAKLLVVPAPVPSAPRRRPEHPRDLTPRQHHVIRPPGQTLHHVAALFGKRTRERILDPIIADMQLEYCDELGAQHPRKAMLWLIQLRAWVAFAEAILRKTVVGRLVDGLSRLVLPPAGGAGPRG